MKKALWLILLSALMGCSGQTSEEHIENAQKFVAQNNFEAAVVELKNAVQQSPQSATARFELGKVYLAMNDFDSAEKELNRALEYGQPASEVIPLLSKAYQRTGAHAALTELDVAAAGMSDAEKAEAGFFKLQSLVQLDRREDALAQIEELGALDTNSVYKGLILAYQPLLQDDTQGALTAIEALRKQSPFNPDVLKLQGQVLLMLQRPEQAADVYQVYVQQFPDDKQIIFILSSLLVEAGRMDEAQVHVDRLLADHPDHPMLNQLKATIAAGEGQHALAQQHAERAITLGRGDPALRLIAGYAAYQNKDFESAAEHLSFVASSLPDNHPALKMLAAAQLQLGQSGEASDVLTRLDSITEQDAPLFSSTGLALIKQGSLKQAREMVERSADISRSADDLARLGVLKLSLNDVEGIVDLEQAVSQSPQLPGVRTTLATAYLAAGQLDKAEALANQWLSTNPDDAEAHLLLGEVASRNNDWAAAQQAFERALAAQPDMLQAKLALANLAFKQGDMDSAQQQVTAVINEAPDYLPGLATHYLFFKRQQQGEEGMAPAVAAYQKAPQRTDLALLLARIYATEGRWSDVESVTGNVTVSDDVPVVYWALRGQALLKQQKVEQAQAHYDAWLTEMPNNKQAVVGKLLLLDSQNKAKEALGLLDKVLTQRDDQQLHLLRAHFLTLTGQFDQAQNALQGLSKDVLDQPFVKSISARISVSQRDGETALPLASDAYEALPNSRNLIVLLAALELQGKTAEGIALLERHLQRAPEDIAAQMLLAERQIGGASGNASAIKTYVKALEQNPNNFVALNNLAYLYMEEGQLSQAAALANKAVEMQPENIAAVDTLAQIRVRQDDLDEALTLYQRIDLASLENDEIFLNYIEALLKAGRDTQAKRRLAARNVSNPDAQARLATLKAEYGI
ncbi:PEP-CTERM system TPR-repeat protein PrsT [Aestuariibacter halophilus]|uniref:PEP-CTERM system TPR-repeat protein PrsT n=1 Tax=Fluctibacter halophilus TaxID=226011 RepID=A0ABS8GBI5_9ALTE|nr:XrtA/PEP-CTERM system TPR-repeat protein PrsT [Aestuariibacter halophilus]MCC2617939.1 PEP-CTERM system TPR-repeat protein PrsT [Aestuariibacter halophilus]